MATAKQDLGRLGEELVVKHCPCPRCKRDRTLKRLPSNFKCADIICDFCGYLAQVKAQTTKNAGSLPRTVLGAAWSVQNERMAAGIYFPLFLVLVQTPRLFAIHYLSADLQPREMFVPRKALSAEARRAGWQGFMYDLSHVSPGAIVRIASRGLILPYNTR